MSEEAMWIVSAASLVGTIANIYRKAFCFWIWVFCNALWVIYDIEKNVYPQAALMAVYFFLAVWGIFKWRNQK